MLEVVVHLDLIAQEQLGVLVEVVEEPTKILTL
jgi:hypothetical protein